MNTIRRSLALAACAAVVVATTAVASPSRNTPEGGQQRIVVDAASTLGKALKGTAWAVVNADGTLARGVNIVSTDQPFGAGLGKYEVIFPKNVDKCNYTATIGSAAAADPVAGFIVVSPRGSTQKGVWIQTWDATGASADEAFHLAVAC